MKKKNSISRIQSGSLQKCPSLKSSSILIGTESEKSELKEVTDEQLEMGSEENLKNGELVKNQMDLSTMSICGTIDDGFSLVSNVKADGNDYEKIRREDDVIEREQRLRYIEKEEKLAESKFLEINNKWEQIIRLKNPLDQYESTESHFGNQCKELLADKDRVIRKLREVLKSADLKLQKDLQKQTTDMTMLLTAISEQETILKRAVHSQLLLIEESINKVWKESQDEFSKLWNDLDRKREESQANNFIEKLRSNIMCHDEIDTHKKLLLEEERNTRIRLDQDIQRVHRDMQNLKAICMLNIDKMDYQTTLLRKQVEENKILKPKQDKAMLMIKSAAEYLKKTADAYRINSNKIKKLRANLNKLYNSIVNELKMRKFSDVHLKKFRQIWKFNKDIADNLLLKILLKNQEIEKHLLQLKWVIPEDSYVKLLIERNSKMDPVHFENTIATRMRQTFEESIDKQTKEQDRAIIKQILNVVADSSGFLMEEKLIELLKPYSSSQRLLVKLSNVFDVLGIRNEDDVYALYNRLESYIECLTCQNQTTDSFERIVGSEVRQRSTISRKTATITHENIGILYQLPDMISERYKVTREIVKELTRGFAKNDGSFSSKNWIQHTNKVESNVLSGEHIATDMRNKLLGIEHRTKRVCREPNHVLTISTANLMKALQDFICKLDEQKCSEIPLTLYDKLENLPLSRLSKLGEQEIISFWNGFTDLFSTNDEKLWDALLIGLREYHDELKGRHYLNNEVEKLRIENAELKIRIDNHCCGKSRKRY